ncbi:MAG: DUF6152 family protein [Gammaproteobacteria bacterium]
MGLHKRLFTIAVLWSAVGILVSTNVLAHHGAVTNGALYLTDDFIELDGELTEVFWRNPHTRARLSVVDSDGEQTIWELELGPTPRTFEAREIYAEDFIGPVKAAGYRSRRNPESLGVVNLLLPNGQEYVVGNRELLWSNTRMANTAGNGVFGLGSANTAEAETTADGIFRAWGRFVPGAARIMQPSEYARYLTPRARELAAEYDPVTQNPELDCRQGMPKTMTDPTPMAIVNDGERIVIRQYEYDIERIVYMSDENVEPQTSPLGHSVGRWEADVLVVATTHIDWPYLDQLGTPQSDQASYRETFALATQGDRLNYSITITDPIMLNEPFTIEWTRQWVPEIELEPYDCVVDWRN